MFSIFKLSYGSCQFWRKECHEFLAVPQLQSTIITTLLCVTRSTVVRQLPNEILINIFEKMEYIDYGVALPFDLCENFEERCGDAHYADMYTDEDGYGGDYEWSELPKKRYAPFVPWW